MSTPPSSSSTSAAPVGAEHRDLRGLGYPGYRVWDSGVVEYYDADRSEWVPVPRVPLSTAKVGVELRREGTKYRESLAALVLLAFGVPKPRGRTRNLVDYADGNPRNCALSNVSWTPAWGTRAKPAKASRGRKKSG